MPRARRSTSSVRPAVLVHERARRTAMGSATRPVTTMSAPLRQRRQDRLGAEVRVRRDDRRVASTAARRVSIVGASRSSASSTSSPVTAATFTGIRRRRAIATMASAAASGLAAPRLLTRRMPLRLRIGSSDSIALGQPRIVPARRVPPPPQLRERDGALGQAFEYQVVERAVLGEVATAHRGGHRRSRHRHRAATKYA